jgi:hypothetical protein
VTDVLAPVEPEAPSRRQRLWRTVILVAVAGLAAFWVWALFFASKEAVNKIDDREWAARAEAICAAAQAERAELIDERRLDPSDPAMLAERAAIVDQATDIVEAMLGDVVAVAPSDDKGRAIVPQWEADYRTHLGDRRAFSDRLRAGENEPFRETAVDGIPISDKLEQFAGDNEMPSCAPPRDLAN